MKKVVSIFIFAVIVVVVNAQKEVKNFKTLEFDYMDLSVEPSDDFYQHATGTWMKNNPVPDEESRWSSFNQLSEKNNTILNAILDSVSAIQNPNESSDEQLLADFYSSFMDTVNRNKRSSHH